MPIAVFGFAPTAYTDKAGFRILNPGTTPYPWLTRWTETDHQIQGMGHLGQGVLRGCRVRTFTPAAYKLKVGSGEITVRGATATLAACEVPVNPPDGRLHRIDVVGAHILSSGAGHVQVFAGTPSNNPFPPLLDPGYVGLDFVMIPASCSAIYANQLVGSKRVLLLPLVVPRAAPTTTLSGLTVSGGGLGSALATVALVPFAGTLRTLFFRTTTSQPGTGDLPMTVRINGVDTSIVATATAGSVAGVFSDTSHTASVAAGDLVEVHLQNGASTTSAAVYDVSIEVDGS